MLKLPAHFDDVTDDISRSGNQIWQESNTKYKSNLGIIKTTLRAIPSKTRVQHEHKKRTKSITRCHNVSQHRDHITSNILKVGG